MKLTNQAFFDLVKGKPIDWYSPRYRFQVEPVVPIELLDRGYMLTKGNKKLPIPINFGFAPCPIFKSHWAPVGWKPEGYEGPVLQVEGEPPFEEEPKTEAPEKQALWEEFSQHEGDNAWLGCQDGAALLSNFCHFLDKNFELKRKEQ